MADQETLNRITKWHNDRLAVIVDVEEKARQLLCQLTNEKFDPESLVLVSKLLRSIASEQQQLEEMYKEMTDTPRLS